VPVNQAGITDSNVTINIDWPSNREAANGVHTLQAPRESQQAPDKRLTSAQQVPDKSPPMNMDADGCVAGDGVP
jgi:aspartyl/asparaginyl beta-hydroxylase (cupin superfamily)